MSYSSGRWPTPHPLNAQLSRLREACAAAGCGEHGDAHNPIEKPFPVLDRLARIGDDPIIICSRCELPEDRWPLSGVSVYDRLKKTWWQRFKEWFTG